VYTLLDNRHSIDKKLHVIQIETLKRFSKPLLGKVKGNNSPDEVIGVD
jgi:hypothetical protein